MCGFFFICHPFTHCFAIFGQSDGALLSCWPYCTCEILTPVELPERNEGEDFYISHIFGMFSGSMCML